ncbi:MAG: VOC family protein [Myxococcaceae bacterium]
MATGGTGTDFTLLGQRFQAMTAGPHQEFNDAISIMVECDDPAELDRYWKALLKGGGKEVQCGWLIDRWGLRWQLAPRVMGEMMASKDRERSRRVTDAMMKMVKLDIAALEAAYEGDEPPAKRRRPKARTTDPRARTRPRRRSARA